MKRIIYRILPTILFIGIGLVLFSGLSDIVRKKSAGTADTINSFYEVEEDTLDALCLGSSLAYSSFQPNVLWNEYGVTSYALSSMKQSLPTSYYLLQEALKYQNPRFLFLESYYFFCDRKYYDEPALSIAMDGMRLDEVKYRMIQDMLEGCSWKEKLPSYVPFLKYHDRWNELVNSDFHSDLYLKGSIFSSKVYPMEPHDLPSEGCEIPEVALAYFEKIVDLCDKHGIQLIVYSVPYGYDDNYELYEYTKKITVTVEKYLKEKEIPFLSFWDPDVAGIDCASDYRDFAHYNIFGAMKVTRVLGDYLRDKYDLTDHRQDSDYESWNQDYQTFEEKLNSVK